MPFVSSTNSVVLVGRVTRDLELRRVGERAVLTLGVAVRRPPRRDDHGAEESTADFFDITVWGNLAETCAEHLGKGRLVGVSGRLEPRVWQAREGGQRRTLDVVAGSVEFLDSPRTSSTEREREPAGTH